MSTYSEKAIELARKIELKLDLMLQLIEAQDKEDWALVAEISNKLDSVRAEKIDT